MNTPRTIAVLYNLPTKRAKESTALAADEDTAESARVVHEALLSRGVQSFLFPVESMTVETIKNIQADCIFNLVEWTGADLRFSMQVMDILTSMTIPFTGADTASYYMSSDKILMKKRAMELGIPTAKYQLFTTGKEKPDSTLPFPLLVKLAYEHCSIGLDQYSVVYDEATLIARVQQRIALYQQPMIAEEYIDGREFQVTVLDYPDGPHMLPPAEIIFRTHGTQAFLTYDSRWDENNPEYQSSTMRRAELTAEDASELKTVTMRTYREMGFRDYARMDIRMRDHKAYLLEPNANPGLGESDEYGLTLAYKAIGMTFADFVMAIVSAALRRNA